jgi:exopolysaccharide biosynthesis WecB/TagA/CpsF family protein
MPASSGARDTLRDVDRIALMGVGLDRVTQAQVCARVRRGLSGEGGGWIVTPNTDILRQLNGDPGLRSLIEDADVVVADGMPIVWACRAQGTPLPERVPGSDLIWSLSEQARDLDVPVFLLGGDPGTAEGTAAALQSAYPGLSVAGTACPEAGFEASPTAVGALVETVRASGAGLVFVALGFPKQERLIVRLREAHPAAWYVGVGISFSFVSGSVRRAPRLLQALGLEWVHRLIQEPRRLARRYLVDGAPFAARMLFAALSSRVRASRG